MRGAVVLRSWAATGLALAAASSWAQISTGLTLGGTVERPAVFDAADLAARTASTQTVTFSAGTTPQTHTYVGTSLYGLVQDAGLVVDPALRNGQLDRLVVATGSDGYRAVYSMGEINPSFGNRGNLVAYAEVVNGVTQPLASDGFARTTAPGDVRGGRYVSNVDSLDVQASAATTTSVGGGLSSSFSVFGDVLRPMTFDLDDLRALPTRTATLGTSVFTGVSFWDLLNTRVGLALDPAVRNDVLGMYVVATGSDGYRSVFSLGELNPLFGNQPDLISFDLNGAGLGSNGFARLVVPNDVLRGRYVSNLTALEVYHAVTAVPEPQTWALFGIGMLALTGVARRRKPRLVH